MTDTAKQPKNRPELEINNILHNIKASKLIPSEDDINQILILIPEMRKQVAQEVWTRYRSGHLTAVSRS